MSVATMTRPGGDRASRRRRAAGWVPQQHGAWAILLVPLLAGCVLRLRVAEGWFLVPLTVAVLTGYMGFNAASLWLKAAPVKRPRYLRPVLVYGGIAALAGVAALWLGGWSLLGWAGLAALLLGSALVLAARRADRSVLSGALTVAAAVLLVPIARHPSPWAWWHAPDRIGVLAVTGLLFGYFFGTVLYVKTMIRERGRPGWRRTSLCWHVAWLAVCLTLETNWVWGVLFAVASARAFVLPRRAAERPLRPLTIGLLEIGLSMLAFAAAVSG